MVGKVDVHSSLASRQEMIDRSFDRWSDWTISDVDRTSVVEEYFLEAEVGVVSRVGNGNSILVKSEVINTSRPHVLILGSHDLQQIGGAMTTETIADVNNLTGPAIASCFGPQVAFSEGFLAARSLLQEDPANVTFVSIGPNDSFASVMANQFLGNLDGVFVTNAIAWNTQQPTITTGARGTVVAELSLRSGQPANDFATAGAFRNPLNTLTHVLGALRDDRGRIPLPGFYDRAIAPDHDTRDALLDQRDMSDAWAANIATARPGGDLTSLERCSMWPVVSVLSIESDTADGQVTPGAATATVAIYLVPDQRHAEVEVALRSWFLSQVPLDLHPSVQILSSSRPYRSAADDMPVLAQSRAAYRLTGREAVLVPAGGPTGTGEVALRTGAPVAFAGLCGPQHGFGSASEVLPRSTFEDGVALAAETCLQLRRT